MRVTITVPEETTTGFVIAADRDPGDIASTLRRHLPVPLSTAAAMRLGTPHLMIACHPANDSPWDLSTVVGEDEDDAERVHHAARHIGVTSVLPVGDVPSGPHVAWLGTGLPPYRNSGRCTADEDDIDGCACVALHTTGLHRFGIPELEITEVACPHDLAALNLLRTTAQRLLPLGRHPGDHTLPNELILTMALGRTPTRPARSPDLRTRPHPHTDLTTGLRTPTPKVGRATRP